MTPAVGANASARQQAGQLPALSPASAAPANGNPWPAYLQKLKGFTQAQASGQAAQALTEAAQANVRAQSDDLGLTFTLGVTDYPNGGGSGSATNNTFTNLRQYGEARLNWHVLDFFGRRPGRIALARANADQQDAQNEIDALTFQQALLDQSIANWAAARSRKALKHALQHVQQATQALQLARHSRAAKVTGITLGQVQSAGMLEGRIRAALAALPRASLPGPKLPSNYAMLPLQPPSSDQLKQAAQRSPQVKLNQAEARADAATARSLWGNGVDLTVYGGYIAEKRHQSPGVQNDTQTSQLQAGPEVGLLLTVPLGGEAHEKRNAAQASARAQQLKAQAAVDQRVRFLRQLGQQWSGDAASLRAAETTMQNQAKLLHVMSARARQPASGLAPEPGVSSLEAAQFWFSVSQVWKARARWVGDVLTWALLEPGYLQHADQPAANSNAGSLCAPLKSCATT